MATRAVSVPAIHRRGSGVGIPEPVRRAARPVAGLLLLVSVVAVPLTVTLAEGGGAVPPAPVRLTSLDPIAGLPQTAWPKADAPSAGLAFVRCTNLWSMLPDGSGAHRLFSMPGLSSPTFSPDGRTIAFLAVRPDGQQVWMAAADGSRLLHVGTLRTRGRPTPAAAGLTWSPDGTRLAFALPPAAGSAWSVWILDVAIGEFEQVGTGGPAPFWTDRSLLDASPETSPDFRVLVGHDRWVAKRLSSEGGDLAAALSAGWWTDAWRKDTAIVRTTAGPSELVVSTRPGQRNGLVTTPPSGERIAPFARPTVLEGGPVAVTLIDGRGGKDLGLFDPATGRWTVLDYAWDPAWSPAPPAVGSLEAAAAASLVRHLLWTWNRFPDRAGLLLEGGGNPDLASFRRLGYTFSAPERSAGGWSIPATLFGRTDGGFGFRRVDFRVRADAGRLVVDPVRMQGLRYVRTIGQAVRLLRAMLTVDVVGPAGLPRGTHLAANALSAWSWGGRTTGQLDLVLPGTPGDPESLSVFYGQGGFGCGPSPVPFELTTGTPAIASDPAESGSYSQVVWPAGPKDWTGPFGLSGTLPRETMIGIAAAMDAERLAGPR
ncbi:MAG: TolB family protein [Actinomycetota bacterium]